jgi:hypothetical protein
MKKSKSKTSSTSIRKRQEVAVFGDIKPDGALIRVDWDKFVVGSSFFIPCMRTKEAIAQISSIVSKMGFRVKYRIRIEGGLYGLRVWRAE